MNRAQALEAVLRQPKYAFLLEHYRSLKRTFDISDWRFHVWLAPYLVTRIQKDFEVLMRVGNESDLADTGWAADLALELNAAQQTAIFHGRMIDHNLLPWGEH